ncbi:MAG: hypothetical protein DRN27_08405 [Thermoplasmata archaeon]|nr:MAG: hypothetical protein DRN27_08405 [Thermoplasmata archaeon]
MNKKHYLIFAIASIGIAALLLTSYMPASTESTSCEVSNSRGPIPMTFHINADNPLDEMKMNSIPCYEIVPMKFDEIHFKQVGKSLGLNGDIEQILENNILDTYVIKSGGKELEYYPQTGVWIFSSDEAFPIVTNQPDLPSDEDAVKKAIAYLKENGLWSDDFTYSHITYDYQRKLDKITDEIFEEFIITKKVCFNREIDGIELAGVGSKCRVTLGEGSEVVAFIQPQQKYQEIKGDFELIQPEKALENFKFGRGIQSVPRTNLVNETVNIEDISLCYFIDTLINEPGMVRPGFIFRGTFVQGNEFKVFTDAIEI